MYSETSKTSKMEFSAKTVKASKSLTILTNNFILDVWLGSECVFPLTTIPVINHDVKQILLVFLLTSLELHSLKVDLNHFYLKLSSL